jgi:hypothetical protein
MNKVVSTISYRSNKACRHGTEGQIVAEIIELVKSYQQGRATDIVADATINFTEGWIPGSDN